MAPLLIALPWLQSTCPLLKSPSDNMFHFFNLHHAESCQPPWPGPWGEGILQWHTAAELCPLTEAPQAGGSQRTSLQHLLPANSTAYWPNRKEQTEERKHFPEPGSLLLLPPSQSLRDALQSTELSVPLCWLCFYLNKEDRGSSWSSPAILLSSC